MSEDSPAFSDLRSLVREFEARRDRSLECILLSCRRFSATGPPSEQVDSYLRDAATRSAAVDEQWFREQLAVIARGKRDASV